MTTTVEFAVRRGRGDHGDADEGGEGDDGCRTHVVVGLMVVCEGGSKGVGLPVGTRREETNVTNARMGLGQRDALDKLLRERWETVFPQGESSTHVWFLRFTRRSLYSGSTRKS